MRYALFNPVLCIGVCGSRLLLSGKTFVFRSSEHTTEMAHTYEGFGDNQHDPTK